MTRGSYRIARICWLLLLALILTVTGWSAAAAQGDSRLHVVATTTQVADLVTIIGGERVAVTALMGAGVDPHLYRPTQADTEAMYNAQIVFYNGLHLEGQFDTVFAALGQRNIRTYAVASPVELAGYVVFESLFRSTGTPDPHFWFDPRNWSLAAEGVAAILAEGDPAGADYYRANAEAYIARLDLLFEWAVQGMTDARIPPEQRVLVTSHDAFQYFGTAFGWDVRGVQGISTVSEASVRDIQDIAEFVFSQRIPVIFIESSVPRRTIEAVQEAVRAAARAQGVTFEVQIGIRDLYSDAMDSPGAFGGTYIGMLASNVITILQSFGYDVPPWPEGLEPAPPAEWGVPLAAEDQG